MPPKDTQPKNGDKPKRPRHEGGSGGQDQLPRELRQELREGQYQQQIGANQTLARQTSSLNLVGLSQLHVYDQVLQLRKHGISVKLGPASIGIMNQLAATRQLPLPQNNDFAGQSVPVDVHSPSYQELDLLNQAFVFMLSLGADLDMPGLEPYHAIKCSSCGEQFVTQAQKDDHCNRGRPQCPQCPRLDFPCVSIRDAHTRQPHPQPHPLPNRPPHNPPYSPNQPDFPQAGYV